MPFPHTFSFQFDMFSGAVPYWGFWPTLYDVGWWGTGWWIDPVNSHHTKGYDIGDY